MEQEGICRGPAAAAVRIPCAQGGAEKNGDCKCDHGAAPADSAAADRARRGKKKIQATADACARAAQFVAAEKPDALVILSPHAELYADWFHISPGCGAQGNFSAFGAPGVRVGAVYDTALAERLCALAAAENFPAGTAGRRQDGLDHGTMIPLWFLRAAYGDAPLPPVVRIGPGPAADAALPARNADPAGGGGAGPAGVGRGQRRSVAPAEARRPLRLFRRGPAVRRAHHGGDGPRAFGELLILTRASAKRRGSAAIAPLPSWPAVSTAWR